MPEASVSCTARIIATRRKARPSLRCGLEVETITEYDFGDQVVSRASETHSEAEVDFPLRSDVEVDGGKNLMLLLGYRIKSRHWAHRAVVFKAAGDLGSEVIAEFEIRRKDDSPMNAFAVKRAVERGVDGPIPSSDLLIDNRANFPSPRVDGKLPALVADFIRETDSHRPVPFGRNANARPNVVADPIPSLARARRSENIKSSLKPVGPSVGDFDCFVQSVVGGEKTIYHLL